MSSLSRRGFVATATSAILAPACINRALADAVDPRVAKIVAETMGIDMHNHVYPAGTQQGPQPGGDPGPVLSFAEELKLSGLTAISAGFAVDRAGNTKPGDARVNFLKWLDAIDAELDKGHVSRALTLKDLRTAHARGQKAIVQTVEGAHFIEGHVERIEEVYKRGLRHLQLLHDSNDMVAPLGDFNGGTSLGGLTPMGADVIKECNRLKILVDMAHGSSGTLLAALKIAKQPIIVSHSRTYGQTRTREWLPGRSRSRTQKPWQMREVSLAYGRKGPTPRLNSSGTSKWLRTRSASITSASAPTMICFRRELARV